MTACANPPAKLLPITVALMCEALPVVFARGQATTPPVSFDLDDWAWAMERAALMRAQWTPDGRGVHGA